MRLPLSAIAALLSVSALVVVPAASAAVARSAFTATVSPNDTASLTVTVKPAARCTIKVTYDTTVSKAKGLGPKKGSKITWSWRVGSTTNPGRWPVAVDCGKSGKLSLRMRVLPS